MIPAPLTIGTYWVDVPCPRCGVTTPVSVHLGSALTTTDEHDNRLKLTAKSKPTDHICGQRTLASVQPDLFAEAHAQMEQRSHP